MNRLTHVPFRMGRCRHDVGLGGHPEELPKAPGPLHQPERPFMFDTALLSAAPSGSLLWANATPWKLLGIEFHWAVAVVLIVALVIIHLMPFLLAGWWWLRRRGRGSEQVETDALALDVKSFGAHGPPAGPVKLEVYGMPVRLVAIVLAPAGHGHDLPDKERLPGTVEQLVPGLLDVLNLHRPEFRCWPHQVSSRGFAQAFFAKVQLPGEGGKGTPWCGIAGKFDALGRTLLAGLILCADRPNGLGQITVQQTTQWLDVLRVKK